MSAGNFGSSRNLHDLFYKRMFFSRQAEYPHFSADFRLQIFLFCLSIIIEGKNLSFLFCGLFIQFLIFIFFGCLPIDMHSNCPIGTEHIDYNLCRFLYFVAGSFVLEESNNLQLIRLS